MDDDEGPELRRLSIVSVKGFSCITPEKKEPRDKNDDKGVVGGL
jgi:hypothetical protein